MSVHEAGCDYKKNVRKPAEGYQLVVKAGSVVVMYHSYIGWQPGFIHRQAWFIRRGKMNRNLRGIFIAGLMVLEIAVAVGCLGLRLHWPAPQIFKVFFTLISVNLWGYVACLALFKFVRSWKYSPAK